MNDPFDQDDEPIDADRADFREGLSAGARWALANRPVEALRRLKAARDAVEPTPGASAREDDWLPGRGPASDRLFRLLRPEPVRSSPSSFWMSTTRRREPTLAHMLGFAAACLKYLELSDRREASGFLVSIPDRRR